MKELTYFKLPHVMDFIHPTDVKNFVVATKELKISEEEFHIRLLPIDFVPAKAFEEFDTIIAKSAEGMIVEYGYNKKGPFKIREFFQSGTRVALITVVPGTERKQRTVKRTSGSSAYREFISKSIRKIKQTAPS